MGKRQVSRFVGRQISRLKYAKDYLLIISNLVSMLSLLTIAFDLTLFHFLLLVPIILLISFGFGYLLDKYNVFTYDLQASVNIQHRKYNNFDQKNQEFQLIQTKILLRAFKNPDLLGETLERELDQKFEAYLERWK